MSTDASVEVWLRGALPGYAPELLPVAHALLQADEDVARVVHGLSAEQLWMRPGGAAAIGFHLQHVAGSLDRLLTYARGESLTAAQIDALKAEGESANPPLGAPELVARVRAAIDAALHQVQRTDPAMLLETREVGRARRPSTVLGLLFHAAEHTTRHVGQIITTAKIIKGS